MSDLPDEISPEGLIERLALRLSMDEDDALALEAKFAELRAWLLSVFQNEVVDVVLIGSLTRRTRLSAPYDPTPDVDCLLVMDTNEFLERYVLGQPSGSRPELLWAEDINNRLRSAKDFNEADFTYNPPYLSLRKGDDIFELTMSTSSNHDEEGGIYAVYGTMTKEEESLLNYDESRDDKFDSEANESDCEPDAGDGRAHDTEEEFPYVDRDAKGNIIWSYENATSSANPISPDGTLYGLILMTDPFVYNGVLDQMSHVYGQYWCDLILIWKYWKKSCHSRIRSYVIEDNVFKGLEYPDPFIAASDDGGRIALLHFIATYFGNRKLYDHELFRLDESFCAFRDGLIRADDLSRSGRRLDALEILASIFAPWEPAHNER